MKNFLNKAMLTLVVFGLAIVSSFAMETDPPTEPVKTTVETEVVEEIQPSLVGYGYYDSVLDECVLIAEVVPPVDCSTMNSGPICTEFKDGKFQNLFLFTRESPFHTWICTLPLKKNDQPNN